MVWITRPTTCGWVHTTAYCDEAADLMAKEYPSLKREAERLAISVNVSYAFNQQTRVQGWDAGAVPRWRVLSAPYPRLYSPPISLAPVPFW